MARILLGANLAEIRGSQGGTTYSRNRFGNYTRNKTSPVNPRTANQSATRSLFGGIAAAWRTLAASQRQTWTDAVASGRYDRTNNFGLTYRPTAFNVFVGVNTALMSHTFNPSMLMVAPAAQQPNAPTLVALTLQTPISATAWPVSTFYSGGLEDVPPGYKLIFEATPPMSPSINFVNENQYSYVADSLDPAGYLESGFDPLEVLRTLRSIPTPAGAKFFLRFRLQNLATGEYVSNLEFNRIVGDITPPVL